MEKMQVIDVETWKRKIPYRNFAEYTNPTFSLMTRLDVTNLVERCKQTGESFFTNFLYIVAKAINQVESLKIRFWNGNPALFEKVHPNYIVLTGEEIIVTCQTELCEYMQFYQNCRRDIEVAKSGRKEGDFSVNSGVDCFYVSCLPWIDLTGVINPYHLVDEENSSIPRITWGKYVLENGRYKMGFDVSAHHALTDGKPIADFMNKISDMLNDLENSLV